MRKRGQFCYTCSIYRYEYLIVDISTILKNYVIIDNDIDKVILEMIIMLVMMIILMKLMTKMWEIVPYPGGMDLPKHEEKEKKKPQGQLF